MNDKFYRIYNKNNKNFVSSRNSDIYSSLSSVKRSLAHKLRRGYNKAEDYVIFEYTTPTGLKSYDGKKKEFGDMDIKTFEILYGAHDE